jgi:hypothetical protein
MVALAEAVAMAAFWAPLSVTTKPSSFSARWSPVTVTLMVFCVSPSAKLTVPEGRVPPKSAALAPLVAAPVTA